MMPPAPSPARRIPSSAMPPPPRTRVPSAPHLPQAQGRSRLRALLAGIFLLAACLIVLLPVCARTALAPENWPAPVRLTEKERRILPLLDAPCRRYHLPPALVMAVIRQESGADPLVINIEGRDYHPKDRESALTLARWCLEQDRSFDVGIMQINRYWIRRYGLPLELLLNARDNIYAGCFILALNAGKKGLTWKSVGHYHSRTPWRRDDYIARIQGHLRDILAP